MYIARAVREMSPPRYLLPEAAKRAGVSVSTLKRWVRRGTFVPQETREFGSIAVPLFLPEDIPALIALRKASRPGPKKKEDADGSQGT